MADDQRYPPACCPELCRRWCSTGTYFFVSPSLQVDAKSLLVCCITAGLWYIQQVDAVATARFGGALFFVFDVGAIVSACRFKIGAFSDVCSREDGAVNTLLLPVLLCCFPLRDLNQVHIHTLHPSLDYCTFRTFAEELRPREMPASRNSVCHS